MAFLFKLNAMEFIRNIQKEYVDRTDQRALGFGLIETPYPTISILVTYCFIVYYGPKYMENRKPLNLKNVLLLYNLGQVIFSTYLFLDFLTIAMQGRVGLSCFSNLDNKRIDSPIGLRMVRSQWLYYITKLVELLDTIFFVLRKKNNQISVLHVYHHVIMAFSWYFVVRSISAIDGVYFLPMINSFVHILMYGYYCLSALGPKIQPYLWWKKYLTKIQMTQFGLILLHTGYNYFVPNCPVPAFIIIHCITTTSTVAILFANFYYQNYVKKPRSIESKKR